LPSFGSDVDLVLAGMLAAAALGLVAAGPALSFKYFWAMRIDLLTLLLFAAVAIVFLFGVRRRTAVQWTTA